MNDYSLLKSKLQFPYYTVYLALVVLNLFGRLALTFFCSYAKKKIEND